MSVTDFAAKKGVSKITVYKWIERQVEDKHNFRARRFGKVILIEETKPTTK